MRYTVLLKHALRTALVVAGLSSGCKMEYRIKSTLTIFSWTTYSRIQTVDFEG